ncbi:NAD(P)/FAD-dependent oxidoreductase [Geodermatophilus sp. Leaf369]|uniref:flavin-containing monooxygenase n=1 Tax=Geodermatophilus sp. Leaf369 TaxID=1736354 RepID=UPI000AA28030|nr:NAD(P)/FAD-dependent oxidoreductase [Geodermatophilus sp. Leaf369]
MDVQDDVQDLDQDATETARGPVDVLVVGAGFAGLYALHRLRGSGLTVRVLDAPEAPGGTWAANRYPGARCDVQSFDYSFSFDEALQQEWSWSERYAAQGEILDYLRHVVDRFDLARDIESSTRVLSAVFDQLADEWVLTTDRGETHRSRFVVMATGCLSVPRPPDIPGLESFRGRWVHTADWPREGLDLTGLRVGLVGTGSSGVQFATATAGVAGELVVFQRSPNYVLPAQNRPMDPEFERELKARYAEHRALAKQTTRGYPVPAYAGQKPALATPADERQEVFEAIWEHGGPVLTSVFTDLTVDEAANETAAEFVRQKIRDIVTDPVTAELLCPYDHPLGTRRPVLDTGYYPIFNRDDVTLVDVRTAPITEITPAGVRTTDAEYELDVIVFATGYDAMTGALLAMDIRGVDGVSLREEWADGPAAYLGVAMAGFPNLFTVTGPGSPSVLTNMVASIEQHVEWISDLVEHAHATGARRVEAEPADQARWVQHVLDRAEATLLPKANSWWIGANVPGKPRVFMPYVGGYAPYGQVLAEVSRDGYTGFSLTR